MAWTISAAVNPSLPGAVQLTVTGPPSTAAHVVRLDGHREPQAVRNFRGTDPSGVSLWTDCEAPLGRAVTYAVVLGSSGASVAVSGEVTCPAPASGKAVLRSVLRPSVQWMECEPADEAGVEWATSTTVHRVVGSDTPVVVGEVRQRRSGTMTFLAKSVREADELVSIMGDGTALLLRFPPCAQTQVRDLLFYALDVQEARYGRRGWRIVSVDYQATRFVDGDTVEPSPTWTYADLAEAHATYGDLPIKYRDYLGLLLDERRSA